MRETEASDTTITTAVELANLSPVLQSVADAFGLALGELALALHCECAIEAALDRAYLAAEATLIADSMRKTC